MVARSSILYLVCLSTLWSPSEAQEEAQVKLGIDDPVHDWGKVYQGQIVRHAFTLTNRGDKAFTIKEVKTRCSCTFAGDDIKNKRLEPGMSVKVALRLETGRLPSEQIRKPGPIKKAGEVITVEGGTVGTLWLEGEILEILRFEPEKVVFEVVRDEGGAVLEPLSVQARAKVDVPVRIERIRGEKKIVSTKLIEKEAGRLFEIEVRSLVPPSTENPRHSDTLEVTTVVDDNEVQLKLPVSIIFKKRIQVLPSQSFFFSKKLTARLGEEGVAPPAKVLSIRSIGNSRHQFRITRVEVEKKRFRTRLEVLEKGRHYKLTVEPLPPPEGARRLLRDKIHVETDDPLVPKITIPGIAQI